MKANESSKVKLKNRQATVMLDLALDQSPTHSSNEPDNLLELANDADHSQTEEQENERGMIKKKIKFSFL